MSFETCMTYLLSWNTKEILINRLLFSMKLQLKNDRIKVVHTTCALFYNMIALDEKKT